MECQTAQQTGVLCTNGYYGFQPVLNGSSGPLQQQQQQQVPSLSYGRAGFGGVVSPPGWQRKRNREEVAVYGNGDATVRGSEAQHHSGIIAAKRPCPNQSKLQQAVGYDAAGAARTARGLPVQNGTDCISIGTDSLMMMGDDVSGMEVSRCSMSVTTTGSVEALTTNGLTASSGMEVATVGVSPPLPPHTCCTSRAQLCTMSIQQSYVLSSSQECPRCLAGEPAPYLSIQQTVENLSKLY